MRRLLIATLGFGLLVAVPTLNAQAQGRSQQEDDERRKQQDEADKKKKQKEKEWTLGEAPLPKINAAGPCPFVRVLYDAARYVELKANKEAVEAVGYTGEIEGVRASCTYKGDEPIRLKVAVGFGLGRGPQAAGWSNTYRYWVAVTLRNRTVLAKQYFDVKADFNVDTDRVLKVEHIDGIVIPRATGTVNGSNFEVLVGFDVSPEMAAFNRDGKRFRMNVFSGANKSSVSAGDSQPK
jgi:hypothetical protein